MHRLEILANLIDCYDFFFWYVNGNFSLQVFFFFNFFLVCSQVIFIKAKIVKILNATIFQQILQEQKSII